MKARILAASLMLLGAAAFSERLKPKPREFHTPLLPNTTWLLEESVGIMSAEHIKNDYGDELDLPYEQLSSQNAVLLVRSEGVFISRTSLILGYRQRPLERTWTDPDHDFSGIRGVDFDLKCTPSILPFFNYPIRPYFGYNYINYLIGEGSGDERLGYYGYHSIQGGLEADFRLTRWLRTYGYFGIAPILISGVISLNPYWSYGGKLYFHFWKVRVSLNYAGKHTPKYLSFGQQSKFKMSELGFSIGLEL